ncbi:hypothetical protein N9R53_07595 [Flavobacteriaceae bacterium]|jgi:hypothetical protein|nr:hypothetical protein [Bacteroidota bacterium]MDA9552778.1 hypothetical protein [Flavobacteriaceae bacterium]MDB2471481.1 hypothetical protein [Flavobacteriaceae bacterium]MDG1380502.1 hypothetical protein [Flavobacteriaceae bacterium]MDG2349415.1 hypothetical protein [Flavobacteriaceae bacterium]|tara:strand:+ start:223 stop:450 length:228 start_codon:yes stop_codon:yes gene_type:complete
MNLTERALEFESRKKSSLSTSDRVKFSREAKELILGLNEEYKINKDPATMDLMKRLTAIKQKIEKRLKGRPISEV